MSKEAVHTMSDLYQMQALPLNLKIRLTEDRIRAWLNQYDSYVSFSGGKDSTVLLDICRKIDPQIPAVFADTGLEYPEIREFVKTFDNVTWVKPKMNFRKVIETYGYPFISKEMSAIIGGGQKALKILQEDGIDITDQDAVISECAKRLKKQKGEWRHLAQCYGAVTKGNAIKLNIQESEKGMYSDIPQKYKFLIDAPFVLSDKCCKVMKKSPLSDYFKQEHRTAITAQMADESRLRTRVWLKHGCNMWNARKPISNPMSFWTEQDVLLYIKQNNIPICSVYGDIVYEDEEVNGQTSISDFGFDAKKPKLKTTGCSRTGCMFCGYGCQKEKEGEGRFERMKITHPKQYEWIMKPWEDGGLGYKEIIDWINEHGNLKIRY